MIDPNNMANFERSEEELFELLLFCVLAAGKDSREASAKVGALMGHMERNKWSEFQTKLMVLRLEGIPLLKQYKTGKYNVVLNFIRDLSDWCIAGGRQLSEITLDDLISLHGIGEKTARMFLTYSRESCQNYAILDTHILSWLREQGVDVPKTTPSGKRYRDIEQNLLSMCAHYGFNNLRQMDEHIWRERARMNN